MAKQACRSGYAGYAGKEEEEEEEAEGQRTQREGRGLEAGCGPGRVARVGHRAQKELQRVRGFRFKLCGTRLGIRKGGTGAVRLPNILVLTSRVDEPASSSAARREDASVHAFRVHVCSRSGCATSQRDSSLSCGGGASLSCRPRGSPAPTCSPSPLLHPATQKAAPEHGATSSPQLLILGSWAGVRRLFHLPVFLTASRMALPQDPGTTQNVEWHSAGRSSQQDSRHINWSVKHTRSWWQWEPHWSAAV